jgi:hypothetical protein
LRRNFATHLKILGLDYPDIQYLLGHCIDDPYINRPDYTDGKLYQLSKHMVYRPLVNYNADDHVKLPDFCEEQFSGRKTISIDSDTECVSVRIHALEKKDVLKIKVNPDNLEGIAYTIRNGYKSYEPRRTINILQKYIDDYDYMN